MPATCSIEIIVVFPERPYRGRDVVQRLRSRRPCRHAPLRASASPTAT